MDPQRHAPALGHQGVERHRGSLRRGVELGDLDGGVGPQGAQQEPLARVGEGRRTMLVPVEHQQEQGGIARPSREGRSGLEDRGGGVVGIVQDHQGRALAPLRGMDRLQGGVGGAGARRVEDRRPGALYLDRELGREPGLADAARAADERSSSAFPLGLRPALAQPAQLALAPGEERRAALELARQLLLERAGVEGGVVAEDGLLELAQLGAGPDPDLREPASGSPRGRPPIASDCRPAR